LFQTYNKSKNLAILNVFAPKPQNLATGLPAWLFAIYSPPMSPAKLHYALVDTGLL